MLQPFIRNEIQSSWIERLHNRKELFTKNAAYYDEHALFPKENINELIKIQYSSSTLPAEYGGANLKVYDMLLLQETLASFDGSTALSIGWNLMVIGELYEKKLWSMDRLQFFAKEISHGALVNRAVTEAQTGSPTRGGKPGTSAVKKGDTWYINGRKIFTTCAPALTYFLVAAWIEEKQTIGYFLIHKDTPGVTIEETWDVISMRGTGSHDLLLHNVQVSDFFQVELLKPAASVNGWLLHIPACYLGIAQAARDYALQFANSYSPNSLKTTISELPHIQQLLGEIDLELIRSRHLMYSVAALYDDEQKRSMLTNETGVVKHAVVNAAVTIVDKAMRIVGAQSLKRSCPLQRYYRDVRAGLHNPPMDDMTIKKLALHALHTNKEE